MPGYFKKRRVNQGPNKNEEKVRRAEAAANKDRGAQLLGQRFPNVSKLTLRIRFHAHGQDIRPPETLVLEPNAPLRTRIPCPGKCAENGSFELGPTIETAVAGQKARAEGNAACQETLYAGLPETCGCQLNCVIELAYRPEPAAS
jgi:hypothetical protein